MSVVRYDGFLTSVAGSVSPALRFDTRAVSLTARGTYLRFESGNTSLDGRVMAVWTAPLDRAGRWRGEVAAGGGASKYADIARFWHGVGEMRLHRATQRAGAWIGASVGRASFGTTPRPVAVAAAGVWTLRSGLALFASLDRSFVGDTAYSDVLASARARRGALTLEASLGARFWSRGGGQGVYGEGSATIALRRGVAVVLGGGRYPTDAISGSIAGRYATLALRLGSTAAPAAAHPTPAPTGTYRPSSPALPSIDRALVADGGFRLILLAPEARSVEIAGTFTDWRPVALTRAGSDSGRWEFAMTPAPRGLHRLSVRVNGGAWQAPGGVSRVAGDYDGAVGVLVLP